MVHKIWSSTFLLLSLLQCRYVSAHAQMALPLPIRSPLDQLNPVDVKDYSYTSPLFANGSNFPCKGYHHDDRIHTTAIYTPGNTYDLKIVGGTNHGGGSCQISLSKDNGETFHVIKSIIGGCPSSTSVTYNFTIPDNAPGGTALLAWTWFNYIGNREMYMNCAQVQIEGSNGDDGLSQLPEIWVANLSEVNSCHTVGEKKQEDVPVFPHPGPDYFFGPPGPAVSAGSLKSKNSALSPECVKGYPKNTYTGLNSDSNPELGKIESTQVISLTSASTTSASSLPAPTALNTSSTALQAPWPVSTGPSTFLTLTSSSPIMSSSIMTLATPVGLAPSQSTLTQPSNLPFGSISDLSPFLPCNPNTFLCTSASKYTQCVASESYGPEGIVPAGLMCNPFSATKTYQSFEGATSGGGPEGTYRDDRLVPASTIGSCNITGDVFCLRGGRGFAICDDGVWRDMGEVAAGTSCVDDHIQVVR